MAGDIPDRGARAVLLRAAVAVEVSVGVADPVPPHLHHEDVSFFASRSVSSFTGFRFLLFISLLFCLFLFLSFFAQKNDSLAYVCKSKVASVLKSSYNGQFLVGDVMLVMHNLCLGFHWQVSRGKYMNNTPGVPSFPEGWNP